MTETRLELTDTEWMQLIDGDREDSQLYRCCANISTLRDSLIGAARNGGRVDFFNQVKRHLDWCFPDHDVTPLIQKVMDQLGLEEAAFVEHESQEFET